MALKTLTIILQNWLLRAVFVCFLLQAITGLLLSLHYEPSLRPAFTESGRPIVILEVTKPIRLQSPKLRFNTHEMLFAEYDTAAKSPFYSPDTLRSQTRILIDSASNLPIQPNAAYFSVAQGITSSADFGAFLRTFHNATASVSIILAMLWITSALLGFFNAQTPLHIWLAGLAMAVCTVGTSVLGYILPMTVQSALGLEILLSSVESFPLIGKSFANALKGSPNLGSVALLRVYILHILVIPALLLGAWYFLRENLGLSRTQWHKHFSGFAALFVGICWFLTVLACCFSDKTPLTLDFSTLPADFTKVISHHAPIQPVWYALGFAAMLNVLPAWVVSIGAVLWVFLAASLALWQKFSSAATRIVSALNLSSLLCFMGLTLWELRFYRFPQFALSEESLEILVVVSILSAAFLAVFGAYHKKLSERSEELPQE